jgi:hypothetical protein
VSLLATSLTFTVLSSKVEEFGNNGIINNFLLNIMEFLKLNLPKSLSKHVRTEKNRIRKLIGSTDEKKKLVDELYKKVLKIKKSAAEKKEKPAKK